MFEVFEKLKDQKLTVETWQCLVSSTKSLQFSFSHFLTFSSSEIREFRPKQDRIVILYLFADGSSFIIPNPGCRSFVALPRVIHSLTPSG